MDRVSILIEIDSNLTFGIDWFKHIKGIRLGFFAIHLIMAKHSDVFEVKGNNSC